MHDIKAIRDDTETFIAGLKRRGISDASELASRAARARQGTARSADASAAGAGAAQRSVQADRPGQGEKGRSASGCPDGGSRRAKGRNPGRRAAGARSRRRAEERTRRDSESARVRRAGRRERGRQQAGRRTCLWPRARHERAQGSCRARRGTRHDGFRARRESVRRALRLSERRIGEAQSRAGELHARQPHDAVRLHRSRAALSCPRRGDVRNGPAAEV